MSDVLPDLLAWCDRGATVGLATVVATWDSAPRPPGTAMLVAPDGSALGSVSGGCVESDVHALAMEVVSSGQPTLRRYGVSDADAASVGLPCGGTLEVFVEPVSRQTHPELAAVARDVAAGRPVVVATVVEHPDQGQLGRRLVVRHDSAAGSLGSDALEAVVAEDAADLLAAGTSASLSYGPDGQRGEVGVGVFAACYGRRPRMLVFGATDFAAALARLGSFLGYAVTVCDARSVFATAARFPDVDELVVDWPHRYLAAEVAAGRVDSRTVLCVLTHDAKFDLPLLELALTLPEVGYLGLMGSRRTVAERERQLRERGSDDAQLARLTRPIGLDLGARTPEETAVSIAAEIISLREGRGGQRLVDLDGRIHSPLQTMGRESRP